ncbi:MAG: hypothetical protein B7733_04555 [Myxococcales bacterium FL481]|nr:MAG: hypothetical protein B7733_04555 [Myxococcales bacterium FL481]
MGHVVPSAEPSTRSPSAGAGPCPPAWRLEHDLTGHLAELARFRRRRQLERSPLYGRLQDEIERVLHGFEWRLQPPVPPPTGPPTLRAAAWNLERGKQLDAILATFAEQPSLRDADLLFLTELDIGMARSGNLNIAERIADELGMAYVFANFHLVLAPGDHGEQRQHEANTLALHGSAIMSRYPIRRFDAVSLPECVDKFHVLEKRLGSKRSLIAEVLTPHGSITAIVVHLDPFAGSRHRGFQMARTMAAARRFGGDRVLLGGDLNTNTYHLGSARGLAANFARKMVVLGFDRTVEQYLTPQKIFERPVFNSLAAHGMHVDGFNDLTKGTFHYDLRDPDVVRKTSDYIPPVLYRWLDRRLEPWQGRVPMRIDWFAGRGLSPRSPWVIELPQHHGVRASDHHPIGVTVDL